MHYLWMILYVAHVTYQIINLRMLIVCELELFSSRTAENLSHSYKICLNTEEKTKVLGTTAKDNSNFVLSDEETRLKGTAALSDN